MPVFESSRKVQVSGSSLAMTLPALFVKASEIEKGSVVSVFYGLDGVLVLSLSGEDDTIDGLLKILEKLEERVKGQTVTAVEEGS